MLDTRKVRKIIRENKAALNFLKEEEEKEKKQKKSSTDQTQRKMNLSALKGGVSL